MRPAWWLPGAHLQSAWTRLRSRRLVTFEREVLTTPDDDDLVLDHLAGPAHAPRALLLHGLEGSAHSFHSQGLALLLARAGWRCTVLNFRSCARDPRDLEQSLPNRRPRLYHCGDTDDLDLVVRTLAAREPASPLFALGLSLGGAVLLRWLGEADRAGALQAAATISAPYDLATAVQHLDRPVGRLYFRHFSPRLKAKALDVLARFRRETAHIDPERVRGARTFREFDDCLTAPLHHFAGAQDYYDRCSILPALARITLPTLCLSSEDDPFFPSAGLQQARVAASPAVRFEVTAWGGHAGFVSGPWPWRPRYWAEERAVRWLVDHARPA